MRWREHPGPTAGPEGERIRDLQLQVGAQKPGTDLTPFFDKIRIAFTERAEGLQDKAAADAATIKTPPPIPAVTQGSPGNSNQSPGSRYRSIPRITACCPAADFPSLPRRAARRRRWAVAECWLSLSCRSSTCSAKPSRPGG